MLLTSGESQADKDFSFPQPPQKEQQIFFHKCICINNSIFFPFLFFFFLFFLAVDSVFHS